MEKMKKSNNIVFTILITGIVLLLNVLFYRLNFRLDLTENKIYSLSKGTKNILSRINENLFVNVYYSKELPAQILATKDYVISVLKDYKYYSKNKIVISYIVVDSEEKKKKALRDGIAPVRFDVISKEKFEQQEGFLGIKLKYLDKSEVFPFIQDISNFEYDLSSKIKNLISENKSKLYFIQAGNSLSYYSLPAELRERLGQTNEVKNISLEDLYKSSQAISAVFIGPNNNLSEEELFYLDQIILRGVRLFLAYDKKFTNLESFFARENTTGIEKIFKANGINIKNTLILDRNSQPIQIATRQGPFIITNIVKYPFFVIATDLEKKDPSLRDINALTLPFVSPIEISTNSSISFEPLIKTSKYSFAKKENSYISINPFMEEDIFSDIEKGPFVIAGILKGKFKSCFENLPSKLKGKAELKTNSEKESFIYLLTTSKFIGPNTANPENIAYFMNIASYITQDNELLEIKPKITGFRALKEIENFQKVLIKYANMILPVIFVLAGGIYFYRKNNLKKEEAIKEYGE